MDRAETLFRYLLARMPCQVFCDIGSRDAETALQMSPLAPQASFVCFEADRDNYQAILGNSRIDWGCFRVEHLAVTNRSGTVAFNVYRKPDDARNRGLGSLKMRRELDPVRVDEVTGITLDGYLGLLCPDARDLVLWIDVEGAALEVFQGATRSLARTNMVFVELEETDIYHEAHLRREVAGLLTAQGFRELLYRPYKGGAFGDALFVSRAVYDRFDLGPVVRRFNLRFPLAAALQQSKQAAFRVLSGVPGFLKVWRRVKPSGGPVR